MDLAADAAEHPHLALGQGCPKFVFLAGEGDQLGRTLERDQRSRLGSVGSEEVAVIVVIEDDDGDPTLLAHGCLDASDPVETNLQLILQTRSRSSGHRRPTAGGLAKGAPPAALSTLSASLTGAATSKPRARTGGPVLGFPRADDLS